jgi:hypothetical protein
MLLTIVVKEVSWASCWVATRRRELRLSRWSFRTLAVLGIADLGLVSRWRPSMSSPESWRRSFVMSMEEGMYLMSTYTRVHCFYSPTSSALGEHSNALPPSRYGWE